MQSEPSPAGVVVHPVRLRVLQAIAGRELTTVQLREALPDIAQATLYRHVRALTDAGFLAVVAERQVRGAVERTYAVGPRMAHADQAERDAMTAEQLRAAFQAQLSELARTFDQAVGPDADRDFIGFGQTVLYVDQDDLQMLQQEVNALIGRYTQQMPDKRRVTLATVLLPTA